MKPDNFISNYDCQEPDLCYNCMWFNGEQCIRQLLTEGDIKQIKEQTCNCNGLKAVQGSDGLFRPCDCNK